MESFLKCTGCNSFFDVKEKVPVSLQCGHTICQECFTNSKASNYNRVKCPVEDKLFDAPMEIPVNHIALEFLK